MIAEDGVTTEFMIFNGLVLSGYDKDGKRTEHYYYGNCLLATEYADVETSLYYYLKNSHGDVIGLTDSTGTLTETYRYDAFGTLTNIQSLNENGVLAETETALSRFLYAGEQLDSTTGLYYLRARQYNTVIGRFTQEDTYLGDGRNLYAYVNNNPLKYVDPSGHEKGLGYDNGNVAELISEKDTLTLGDSILELKNDDGTYSWYDNQRGKRKKVFHEQLLVFDISKPNISLDDGLSVGLGSIEGTVITGGWEWEHVDLSLLDFLSVEVSGNLITSEGMDIEAMAAIWSPSIEFSVFDITISLEGYVGGAGVKAQFSPSSGFGLGAAYGVGGSVSIRWEEEE